MTMSSVTILLPQGRRQTIKVSPNTSILQILEDACGKHSLNPEEYDLVSQRRTLDLSLPFRFANIANNGCLELCPTKSGPKKVSQITVCLQLESGKRLMDEFPNSASLWDIISYFQDIKGEDIETKEGEPICIYMRSEIVGETDLEKTTLRKLGITGGKIMIRLMYRSPQSLKYQAHEGEVQLVPSRTVPEPKRDQEPPKQVAVPAQAKPVPEIQSVPSCSNDLVDPMYQPSCSRVFSWSSQGNRLGGPSTLILNPQNSGVDQSNPIPMSQPLPAIDLNQVEFIGERNALLIDHSTSVTQQVELPAGFFEHSTDDVKYLFADLQRQRKTLEQRPLLLQTYRDSLEKKKLERFQKTSIRIQFPDRMVLQAVFDPEEKVSCITDFVQHFLEDSIVNFYLYTIPPREVLDPDSLLREVNLVPAALVHFGCDQNHSNFIKNEFKAKVSTLLFANQVATALRLATRGEVEPESPMIIDLSPPLPTSALHMDESGHRNVSLPRPTTKTVPKWFKK